MRKGKKLQSGFERIRTWVTFLLLPTPTPYNELLKNESHPLSETPQVFKICTLESILKKNKLKKQKSKAQKEGAERSSWERKQLIRTTPVPVLTSNILDTLCCHTTLPFTVPLSRLLTSQFSHQEEKQKLSKWRIKRQMGTLY